MIFCLPRARGNRGAEVNIRWLLMPSHNPFWKAFNQTTAYQCLRLKPEQSTGNPRVRRFNMFQHPELSRYRMCMVRTRCWVGACVRGGCPRVRVALQHHAPPLYTNTGAYYLVIRFFRISPQAPGVPNKHTGWLIGCPKLVWRGNLQGFCLVDYIFCSAWCSF